VRAININKKVNKLKAEAPTARGEELKQQSILT